MPGVAGDDDRLVRMSARRRAVAASSTTHDGFPLLQHDAVVALGRLPRDRSLPHIGEHTLRVARERIAMPAAARRVEPEDVAGLQRVVGVAGRQALGLAGVGVDPDVAGATDAAAGAAVRRE